MGVRFVICVLALALLGSCGRKAPAVEPAPPATHAAVAAIQVDELTPTRLEDDALRALVRGATFRYAYDASNVTESFSCNGEWIASQSAPTEGAYDVVNGRLCTTLADQTTCRRLYRHNGNLYANPLAYSDRETWAFPLVIVRRGSCT